MRYGVDHSTSLLWLGLLRGFGHLEDVTNTCFVNVNATQCIFVFVLQTNNDTLQKGPLLRKTKEPILMTCGGGA